MMTEGEEEDLGDLVVPPGPAQPPPDVATVVFGLLLAFLVLLLARFFGLNGAFWNTIANPLGDG